MTKTKIFLIAFFISIFFSQGFLITGLAQEIPEQVVEMIKIDEISHQDLNLSESEPMILPGNPLYVVKDVWRGITKAVTFDPVKKVELELQYANEKIIETKTLINKNEEKLNQAQEEVEQGKAVKQEQEKKIEEAQKIIEEAQNIDQPGEEIQEIINQAENTIVQATEAKESIGKDIAKSERVIKRVVDRVEKGLDKYTQEINRIEIRTDKMEEKFKDNPEFDQFLDKFTDHQFKQQKLLRGIENDIPGNQAFEKIEQVQGKVLENFGQVINRFQEPEQIQETLTNMMARQEGSDFKDFRNLEVLEALEDRAPESAIEAIRMAQDNTFKRMTKHMEEMPDERREMFQDYVQHIPGNEVRHMAVIHDFEAREIPDFVREVMEEAKEKAIEGIEQRMRGFEFEPEKQMFFQHLEQGKIHDLRMIKELENNLGPKTIDQILAVKNKAMLNFKQEFEMVDMPEKQEEFFKEIERFHDVKQFEVFQEIEKIIPEDKKEIFEKLKIKAMEEMKRDVEMARTIPGGEMIFDKLAGDMPEHIAIIKEFGPPPEMLTEIMRKQAERLSQRIDTEEDATKLAFLKARIEEEETIKNELEASHPEIFRKIDEREDMLFMDIDKERVSQRIGEARGELAVVVVEMGEIKGNSELQEMLRRAPTYVLLDNAQKHLDKAEAAFDDENYGEAFGLATSALHQANSVLRIIKETQLRGTMEHYEEPIEMMSPEIDVSGPEMPICPMVYEPVCGKDGKTYGNYCQLKSAGIDLEYEGPCGKPEYKLFEKMQEVMPEQRFEEKMFEMLPPNMMPQEVYKEHYEEQREMMPEMMKPEGMEFIPREEIFPGQDNVIETFKEIFKSE
ncbi:hypothetical protein KAU40_00985 [Candidatus Parcubacteria bacterium]|nr:hypothetical protein [Candidatus Parcubacteria bacterium]